MLVGSTLPVWLFLVPLRFLWIQWKLNNTLYGLTILYLALQRRFIAGLSQSGIKG